MTQGQSKHRGGRTTSPLPPRINAGPEEIAQVLLRGGVSKRRVKARTYRCGVCHKKVRFPDALHADGRCMDCRR